MCNPVKLSLLIATTLAAGCSWNAPFNWGSAEPVDEAPEGERWETPYARLGLVPVFPPSEDLRVGDLFVYPFNPDQRSPQDEGPRLALNARWNTLALLQELDAEYRLRPDWPGADAGDEYSLFAPDRTPSRLRNFGLAEFSTFKLLQGEANSLVPTEAINLVFGSAWNDNKAVSMRINSAQTYSLGLQKIIAAAFSQTGTRSVLKPAYRENLGVVADPAISSVWLRIPSDVVYVRSMDIIIQARAGFDEDDEALATEFVAEVEPTVTVTETIEDVPESDAGSSDDVAQEGEDSGEIDPTAGEEIRSETVSAKLPEHALDPAYTAFVRANAINEMLAASGADDLPGGKLRFINVTDDSVTIRRSWQRGLAVGVRGLTLEIDKDTGTVVRSAPMGNLKN